MFRPGLISNMIWKVISNCLSQSGFELKVFEFTVFRDAHTSSIMFESQLKMVLHRQEGLNAIEKSYRQCLHF